MTNKHCLKSVVSVLLSVALILAFASCGTQKETVKKKNKKTVEVSKEIIEVTAKNEGKFSVGYGRAVTTPEEPTALAGYGNTTKRLSDGYRDDLYASCIAVTDTKGNTALLISLDIVNVVEQKYLGFAGAVEAATGVKSENIIMTSSHTHSAPDLGAKLGANTLYNQILQEGIVKAAVAAMEDRSPAELYYGDTQTSALNFVRHYYGDDGTLVGDNHNAIGYTGTIVRHVTESDRTLHIIKFARKDKKDILFANYRAHGTFTGGSSKTEVSADWIGAFRAETEKALDCYLSYFQGTAGNVNPTSRISSENLTKNHSEHGKLLSEFAISINNNLKKVDNTDVKVLHDEVVVDINHSEDAKAPYATIINKHSKEKGDESGCVQLGKPYGIYSSYHARGILTKVGLGQTKTIPLTVFSIGDIGVSCASFEQFTTNGQYIKTNSPFKYTIALGYTNGSNSYFPSSQAFDYGCYEVDIGTIAKGGAEKAADKLLEMLGKCK